MTSNKTKLLSKAAIFAGALAVGAPTNVVAQSQTDPDIGTYTGFRYVEGANEVCEFLTNGEMVLLSTVLPDTIRKLKSRYKADEVDKADTFDRGQIDGKGCPSRSEKPALWAQVDKIKLVTKAFMIAPSYMTGDPGECSTFLGPKMPAKEWTRFRNLTLNDPDIAQHKTAVETVAKDVAKQLDEDCVKPKYGTKGISNTMRPAIAHLTVLEDANDAMQRKIGVKEADWNNLFSIGSQTHNNTPEKAFWRSSKTFTDSSNKAHNLVVGIRGRKDTIAAVTASLYSPTTFGPGGTLYLNRDAAFKVRIDYGIHDLKIVTLDGKEFPFELTSRDEGNAFLAKTYFAMDTKVRDGLISLKPETDFHVQYQEKEGGPWKVFNSGKGKSSLIKVGWFGQAYQWATVPSALGKNAKE